MQHNPAGVTDSPEPPAAPHAGGAAGTPSDTGGVYGATSPSHDDLPEPTTLTEDLSALVDSGRTYAQAEIAFQKTRAALVGKNAAKATGAAVLALVLLHIALIALSVGFVIALAPLITIWGAIAVVVGALLLGVGILAQMALRRIKGVSAMFAPEDRA